MQERWLHADGVLSIQNLSEFYTIITSKVKNPLDTETARGIIHDFIHAPEWKIIRYNEKTILTAIDLCKKHNIHFWDSLIASAMREENIKTIFTEDTGDFQKIPGLKVINPLK